MQQVVSITSQGQMTIPAKMKRLLDLDDKALVQVRGKKLVVEPVGDILKLGGAFKDRAIKGKSIDEVIKLEEKAVEESMAEEKPNNG
jgi:bifunctional DNA-binding transcriptional regulator/antitoxin component of YhaV-PrlF toxin-antitoxin module